MGREALRVSTQKNIIISILTNIFSLRVLWVALSHYISSHLLRTLYHSHQHSSDIGDSLLWELAGIDGCFSFIFLSYLHISGSFLKSFYFVGFVLYVRGSVF